MGLRDKLKRDKPNAGDPRKAIYEQFGMIDNPFPSAGQPTGHPRLEGGAADDKIVASIKQFERDHASQVLVVEGTQGVGKTNLLNYYQKELQDLYNEDTTFYIIRYYPDPEPTFDAIVRRVFQELDQKHLVSIGRSLRGLERKQLEEALDLTRSHELRIVLGKLTKAATISEEKLSSVAELAMEWLLGLRLLNKHRDGLGVQFRLDTVESKTQALRDIVFISEHLNLLKGIFLLLDELEKQDYSLSKTPVLRYLSAIRALIDALPKRLFLMLALTSEARRRYFEMLPAIASRLQNRVTLSPLLDLKEATALADFYVANAKKRAKRVVDTEEKDWKAGQEKILTADVMSLMFQRALRESADRGIEGVIHRDFLNRLRLKFEEKIAAG